MQRRGDSLSSNPEPRAGRTSMASDAHAVGAGHHGITAVVVLEAVAVGCDGEIAAHAPAAEIDVERLCKHDQLALTDAGASGATKKKAAEPACGVPNDEGGAPPVDGQMTDLRPVITSLAALVAGSLLFLTAAPAHAHGPCDCLTPRVGPVGAAISIPRSYAVMKIVWNPHPRSFPAGSLMERHARRAYYAGERTLTLYRARKPRRGATFEVPFATPGRHMVQIFDGTEGGTHYTWGFFRAVSTSSLPHTGARSYAALVAVLIALGLILVVISTFRAKRDPPAEVATEPA